jgi:hypothetical protein
MNSNREKPCLLTSKNKEGEKYRTGQEIRISSGTVDRIGGQASFRFIAENGERLPETKSKD